MASVRDVVGNRPMDVNVAWVTVEGTAAAQAFKGQPGDVLIVTFPKTGTTWCQQLCHQLRTGGHLDFDEISEVVPWLEIAPSIGQQLDTPQIAPPRCFKTHQRLSAVSHLRDARFLCVVREPAATLVSEFKQKLAKGSAAAASNDVNAYARQKIWLGDAGEGEIRPQFGGTIWDFYVEMWQCRGSPEVRVIAYEHMKADIGQFLSSVAEFMGLPPPSEELRATVLELSSFAWMAAHDQFFDDHHITRRLLETRGGTFGWKESAKVGLVAGEGANLSVSEETQELLERQWRTIVTPVTGHTTYADMIADLRARPGRL